MKKYISIFMSLAMMAGIVSCSKETPFDSEDDVLYGKFSTASLNVALDEDGPRQLKGTRAAVPSVNDFTVELFKDGTAEAVKTYRYAEMPEVVELPVGSYTVRASYGNNAPAEWEAPYYKGEGTFLIEADKISEVDETVVCRFSNVCVSVDFDANLRAKMADDCKVSVKVGDSGSLDFTLADTERSGYFAYVEDSHTLAATFSGTVDGYMSSETKAYENVAPGTHYKITFRLHDAGEEDPGQIGGSDIVVVDASVEYTDKNVNIESGEEGIVDDMRPKEDPDNPDNPDQPKTPQVSVSEPYKMGVENEYIEGAPWQMTVTSSAEGGITAFVVDIKSDKLTPEELANVGLTDHIVLDTETQFTEALTGLGFPGPAAVKGGKELKFDLSQFTGLLSALGAGKHDFIFQVTDANGTTNETFTLVIK